MAITYDRAEARADLLDRFQRYVRVHTTSDPETGTSPSTERQFDLAQMLASELRALGVDDVTVTEFCYVVARIPATAGVSCEPLMVLAHIDTAPGVSGENVQPILHERYDGTPIALKGGVTISPDDYPELLRFRGDTIITADGTTLLGADDKAGVAEIMTVVRLLMGGAVPAHGEIEVVFTPDEEIGHGVDRIPLDDLHSRFGVTLDGDAPGVIEAECFSAWKARVEFEGYAIHPGYAKGKLVNAATLAARFVTMLPQNESPEATDGADGFYTAVNITGNHAHARVDLILRDFETAEVERRVEVVRRLAAAIEASAPPAKVTVHAEKQYLNMRDALSRHPEFLEMLGEAVRHAGLEPVYKAIRGGTDGARLTEMGVPTPNLFAGGFNFHGPYEWIAVGGMERAVETVLALIELWRDRMAPRA